MTALRIGNARCSTDELDLTVQHEGLAQLGVTPDRIYVDHGLTREAGAHSAWTQRRTRTAAATGRWDVLAGHRRWCARRGCR